MSASSEHLRWMAEGPEATEALGRAVGRWAEAGLVLGLVGPLGSGKTTFVRGVAQGLDVPADVPVTSPTFALVNHYPGRLPLVHVDAYRLRGPEDLRTIDADDWLPSPGVTAIEWADRLVPARPESSVWVSFHHREKYKREIHMQISGRAAQVRREQLRAAAQQIPNLRPIEAGNS